MEYDIFVSYCHKDKLQYVDHLVKELKKLNIKVFYDEDDIAWGDDINERIENGLKSSKLAIVVISNSFFGREWTERELMELFKRQTSEGRKLILPLLYKVEKKELKKHYPYLANISFKHAKGQSTQKLAEEAKKRIRKNKKEMTNEPTKMRNVRKHRPAQTRRNVRMPSLRNKIFR